MDYKTAMRFLRANWLWQHWIVNDILLVKCYYLYYIWWCEQALILLDHYVPLTIFFSFFFFCLFYFYFFNLIKKEKRRNKKKIRKNIYLFIYLFLLINFLLLYVFVFCCFFSDFGVLFWCSFRLYEGSFNSNTSFMILGAKLLVTLKISVTKTCRFLWWTVTEWYFLKAV